MRIRSSAASIAAFVVVAGVLAGCTAAAPEPSVAPTASTPAPDPTPSATVAIAPDLAALCEQLLPRETVQQRFGADLELVPLGDDEGEPDLATWGALAQGSVPCLWNRTSDAPSEPVVAVHLRTDVDFFEMYRSEVEPYVQEDDRLDHYGESVEQCWTGWNRCESAIRIDEDRWVAVLLPAGEEGFDTATVREELAPLVESIVERARELDIEPAPLPQPACDDLIALDDARTLAQAEDLRQIDGRSGLEGNSEVGGLWHPAYNTVPCAWALPMTDGFEFAAYAVAAEPATIEAAWAGFDAEVTGSRYRSTPIDVVGAERAVRVTAVDGGWGGATEFVVDGTWVRVLAPAEVEDAVIERIVATIVGAGA